MSGTVKDAADNPIEGATVALVVEGSAAATNKDGRFAIEKAASHSLKSGSHIRAAVAMRNSRLSVLAPGNNHVTIELFDAKGRLVSTAVDVLLAAGRHEFLLSRFARSNGLFFVRARVGNRVTLFRYAPVGRSRYATSARLGATPLAKPLAVKDTLRASKAGFETQSRAVSSYAEVVDFTLKAVSVGGLVWQPPAMSNPHVVHAQAGQFKYPRDDPDKAGVSFKDVYGVWQYNPDVDVVIFGHQQIVPATESVGVYGGRHVRWIGGHYQGMFQSTDQNGSFFVEGVHIDCQGVPSDAFVIRWHQEVADAANIPRTQHGGVFYQHCLAQNITGGPGLHGDGIQAQSPVDFVVVEEMTVTSNEQAIFIPVQDTGTTRDFVYFRKINTHYAQGTDNSYLRSYWFYDGTSTARDERLPLFPWTLTDVWADDLSQAPETTWVQAVFPQPNFTWGPSIHADDTSTYAQFPSELEINGVVRKGQPPGGDFVTPATCGLNYTSPWPSPR